MIARTWILSALALCMASASIAADGALTDRDVPPVERWREDKSLRFDASEVELDDFRWIARPVVVFADTAADPRLREQLEHLEARPAALSERDVVVIVDTDPKARTDIRRKLRPRGFMLALIGKDGGVKLRKPLPWDVRELSRTIDKMPMRRQEIRDRSVSE